MPFALIPTIRSVYLLGLEPHLFLNLISQKLTESLLPTDSPWGLRGPLLSVMDLTVVTVAKSYSASFCWKSHWVLTPETLHWLFIAV